MDTPAIKAIAGRVGVRHRTATQFVGDVLREAIATGGFSEGHQLLQNEIADALGVSRTPVRESLRLLEAEGWVEFSPHRGAVVATLSSDEVRQIFEIRFVLEALALKQSVPRLRGRRVRPRRRAPRRARRRDGYRPMGGAQPTLPPQLVRRRGARLVSLIESQYDAVDRYLRLELVEMDNAGDSQVEHRAILSACRARDVARAVALSEPHIAGAGIDLAEALERRRHKEK